MVNINSFHLPVCYSAKRNESVLSNCRVHPAILPLSLVSISQRRHAGALLEEIGHGTLVAETEVVGNLAHRHVCLFQQVAYLLIDQRRDMFVYRRAAYFLHQP